MMQALQEQEEGAGRSDTKKTKEDESSICCVGDDDSVSGGAGSSTPISFSTSLSVGRSALPDETSTIATTGTARLLDNPNSTGGGGGGGGGYYHRSSSLTSSTRTRRTSVKSSSISSSLNSSSYNNNNNNNNNHGRRTSQGSGAISSHPSLGLLRSEQLEICSRTETAPSAVMMMTGAAGGGGRGRVPESSNMMMTRRQSLRLSNEFTMDKLRFDRLGLVGREKEIAKLLRAYDEMFPSSCSNHNSNESKSLSFKRKRRQQKSDSNSNNSDERKLVLIAGAAGVGKTVLAKSLQSRVQRTRGFYLTGKYSQPQQPQQESDHPGAGLSPSSSSSADQPYAGIASCCQELCEQVISYCSSYAHEQQEEDEELPSSDPPQSFPTREELQATIHKELDPSELHTLITNFPSLMPIIGITNNYIGNHSTNNTTTTIDKNNNVKNNYPQKQQDDNDDDVTKTTANTNHNTKAGYLEAKHSFNYAFRRFMRVMSHLAPIVFVIDDLQWADQGTLDLLTVLLKDSTSSSSTSSASASTEDDRYEQPKKDDTSTPTTSKNDSDDATGAAPQAITRTHRGSSNGGVLIVGTYRNEAKVLAGEAGVHDDGLVLPLHKFVDDLRDHILYRNNSLFSTAGVVDDDNKDKSSSSSSSSMLSMQTITIGNLSLDATLQLLIEVLSADQQDERLGPLAECVYRKTQGNAFFLVQFLTSLQSQNLLRFHYGILEWRWDLSEIDQGTVSTANVVDFMSNKLHNLPPLIRGCLALAACFGATFRVDLFEIVVERLGRKLLAIMSDDPLKEETNGNVGEKSPKWGSNDDNNAASPEKDDDDQQTKPEIILERCTAEGLIEPLGNGTYRWIHDKIQEASQNTLLRRRADLSKLQYDLGCALLEKADDMQNRDEIMDRDIFVLANLFRQGGRHVRDDDNLIRHRIANLNLRAGEKAIESSAFGQAAGLLKDGISLLPANSWQTRYSLCLKLYSTAAEAHYCVGDMEKTHEYCETVLRQANGKPLLHKRRAYDTQISAMMAEGRHADATNLILVILKKLKVRLPKSALDVKGISKLLMTQMKTKKIIAKLESSPLIQNEMESWTLFLLFQLVVNTYQTGSKLLPLAILKGLEFILNNGVSDVAPSIVATVGFVMAAFLNDPEGGKLYGDQASALLSRLESKNYEARSCAVLGYFVMHWSSPAADCMKMLLKSYHSGMVVGDTEWSSWAIFAHMEIAYNTGGSLSAIERDCIVFAGEMKQFRQHKVLYQLEILWQSVLNLMGESHDPLAIKGDVMDEAKVAQELDDEHDQVWFMNLRRNQVQLAVILGDYRRAMKFVEEEGFDKNALEKASPGYFPIVTMYFHCMLAAASVARETKKKKYHRMAEKFTKQIKSWSKKGNPNVLHHAALAKAELLDLKGSASSAGAWFAQSIMVAGRRGLCHDRAMAHERFGDFLLRQNDPAEAKYHYSEAINLHSEWGASAKVDQIKKKHRTLLSPPNEIKVDDSGRLLEGSMNL